MTASEPAGAIEGTPLGLAAHLVRDNLGPRRLNRSRWCYPRVFEGGYFLNDNSYDVAPDGRRFLMIKEDPAELVPAHFSVVLNWFEDVKRRAPKK
jgi:hypothetical protein